MVNHYPVTISLRELSPKLLDPTVAARRIIASVIVSRAFTHTTQVFSYVVDNVLWVVNSGPESVSCYDFGIPGSPHVKERGQGVWSHGLQ